MAAVDPADPAEKIIDDENRSPTKEYPVVEFPESLVDNGHKRKMTDSDVAENEAGDAKKQKTGDVEKPTAPKIEDITAEDVAVDEQAEEAKPEETPGDLNKAEEKLLEGNAPETEITAAAADAHDDGDKKEADEVTPVAN